MSLCPWPLYSINNETDMSIAFCEFSLFVNIKYLHNIRIISSINSSSTRRSLQTEFYDILSHFKTIWWIGPWSMANPATNFHENRCNTFWDILATDKQTDKHRWKHNLLTEVIRKCWFINYMLKKHWQQCQYFYIKVFHLNSQNVWSCENARNTY